MLSAKKPQKDVQWTKIVVLGDGAVGKSGELGKPRIQRLFLK